LTLPSGVTGQISAADFAGNWGGAAAQPGKFKSLIVGTDTGKIFVSKWQLDAAPWNDANPAWPETVLALQTSGKVASLQAIANQLISVANDSAIRLWNIADLSSKNAVLVQRQVFTQAAQPAQAWLLPDASGDIKTILSVAAVREPTLSQIASLTANTVAAATPQPAANRWISLDSQGKYLVLTRQKHDFDGTLYERDDTGTYTSSKLEAAPSALTAAVLTTDEQHFVLGSSNGTVRCYNSAKSPHPRQPEANVPLPSAIGVKAIIPAFDAVVVVWLDDGSLWSIDFTTPTEANPIKVSWPEPESSKKPESSLKVFSALAFVPGSNNLLAAAPDAKAPTQKQQVLSFPLGAWLLYGTQTLGVQSASVSDRKHPGKHRGPIYAISFDPATRRLATAAGDGIARVWPMEKFTGNPVGQFPHSIAEANLQVLDLNDPLGTAAYGVAFSNPDSTGKQLLATAGADGSVKFWDVSKPDKPVATVSGSSAVLCLDGSADGSAVVVGRQDGKITVFDFATQHTIQSGDVGAGVRSIAFDPYPSDTKHDVVGLINDKNELVLWSFSSNELVNQKDCCAFAWKPDGSQIVASSPSGVIKIVTVKRP
jgi:WD40 repeat protein